MSRTQPKESSEVRDRFPQTCSIWMAPSSLGEKPPPGSVAAAHAAMQLPKEGPVLSAAGNGNFF